MSPTVRSLIKFLSYSVIVRTTTTTLTKIPFIQALSMTSQPSSRPLSNTKKPKVVVVGSTNYDLTSYTPTLPVMGETVMGESFATGRGGKGANQAIAAASLGMAPVTMICRVGNDMFGEALTSSLRQAGVHLPKETVLQETDKTTSSGVAAITVDTKSGDNCIVVTPGANFQLEPSDVDAALSSIEPPPSVVVVQLEIKKESALQALKTGKRLGAITILNPAPAPDSFDLEDFYPYTDILIPNESELQKICGTSNEDEEVLARRLLDKGVGKAVIVTLGARGAMIVAKDDDTDVSVSIVTQPDDLPCKDDPVQDTIGAGDAFCGALSTYLSVGLGLSDAGGKACGFASMSVRRTGANYPTPEELPPMLLTGINNAEFTMRKPLTFVTGNRKKLEEVSQILQDNENTHFELVNEKIDLPELQGDPISIAEEKCRIAAKKIGGACFTEDTSLCFNALGGMPGPYIKWFLENCGHEGLNKMLDGFDDRSAYAQTVIAFTTGPNEEVFTFDGRTNGKVVLPRGPPNFGWDPIFEPDEGKGKTYAEMAPEEKNAISHRSRSLAKFKQFLADKFASVPANV